jgi:hypothetical protein
VTNTRTRAKQKGVYVFTQNAKRTGDQNAEFVSSDVPEFVRKLIRSQRQGHLACWRRGHHFCPAECWIGRRDHFIDSSHNPQQRHNTAVQGYTRQMKMKLTKSISCKSGLVQLWYEL